MSWMKVAYGGEKRSTSVAAAAAAAAAAAKLVPTESVAATTSSKQFMIVEFLKCVEGRLALTARQIEVATHIDIERDPELAAALAANRFIDVVDGTYAYRPEFHMIKSKADLLDCLHSTHRDGIVISSVLDCYVGIKEDIDALIKEAKVICVRIAEKEKSVLYPRLTSFPIKLSGSLTVKKGDHMVETTEDLRGEIRRGDCIRIEGRVYRVDATVKGSKQAPSYYSSSSLKELSSRYVYVRPFTATELPLDPAYDGESKESVVATRDGASNDVRELWRATRRDDRWPRTRADLEKIMLDEDMTTKDMLRPRHRRFKRLRPKETARKRKKRRRARIKKLSNAHLEGTALGRALAEGRPEEGEDA